MADYTKEVKDRLAHNIQYYLDVHFKPNAKQITSLVLSDPVISASPDMYEALKALIDHFRTNDENYYKSELCTDAIVALAKAEGK